MRITTFMGFVILIMKITTLASLFLFSLSSLAEAAPITAMSRHGTPKYDLSKDTHFKYRDPNAKKGGRVVIGAVGTFDSINPLGVKGISSEGVGYTTAALMRRAADEPFTIYANIAESMDVEPDSSKVTFKLNPKATFHDGTPVTAEDVRFTIELLRDKGLPRYKNHFGPKKLKNIIVEDTHTVTFEWNPDENSVYDPEMPMIAGLVTILSKKQLEGQDFITFNQTPLLAAGPYKIKNVEFGKRIILERIKNYWGENLPQNKGSANFDEIEILYIKNPNTHFQEFLTGNVDIYFEQDVNQWKTRYDVPAVKEGRIKKLETTHNRPVAVRTIAFNMRRPIFSDIRLRRALDLALDFETLNKLVFFGNLKRAKSLFENTILAHRDAITDKEMDLLQPHKAMIDGHISKNLVNGNLFTEGYTPSVTQGDGNQRENIAKADKLLVEAGWTIVKGKRVNAKSEHLTLEFLIKDPRLEKVALAYQRSLGFLGINLKVRLVDNVQYEDRTSNRDFDMILHTWSNSLSPGAEQAYYFGMAAADAPGSSNYIGLKDELIENLAKDINHAKDYEDLIARVHNLDRFVMHMHIMIPVSFDNTSYIAYNAKKIGFPEVDPLVGVSIVDCGYALDGPKESTLSTFTHWIKSWFYKG